MKKIVAVILLCLAGVGVVVIYQNNKNDFEDDYYHFQMDHFMRNPKALALSAYRFVGAKHDCIDTEDFEFKSCYLRMHSDGEVDGWEVDRNLSQY